MSKASTRIVVLIVLVLLIILGARLISGRRAGIPGVPAQERLTSTALPSTALMASTTSRGIGTLASAISTATPAQPNDPGSTSPNQGAPSPSLAQTATPPQIPPVLSVVELQTDSPTPGGQIVWILNRSNGDINLGCWALHSTTTGLTLIVEPNLQVPAGAAAMLIPQEAWLGVTDQIQLLDPSHKVIDQTPELRDDVFDDQLWFRTTNGEWTFGRTQLDMRVVQGHISTQTPSGC